jgi:hypothetical protein
MEKIFYPDFSARNVEKKDRFYSLTLNNEELTIAGSGKLNKDKIETKQFILSNAEYIGGGTQNNLILTKDGKLILDM